MNHNRQSVISYEDLAVSWQGTGLSSGVCNVDLETEQLQPSSLPRNTKFGNTNSTKFITSNSCVKRLETMSGTQQVGMPNVYREGR
jgi:hypothetical protein